MIRINIREQREAAMSITIDLPEDVYERMEKLAEKTKRRVDERLSPSTRRSLFQLAVGLFLRGLRLETANVFDHRVDLRG